MFKKFLQLDYYNELLELLFKNKSGAIASNLIAPLFIAYFLHEFIPILILLIFIFIQFALGLLRLQLSKKGLHALKNQNRSEAEKYLKYLLLNILITGLFIGSSSLLCIIYGTQEELYLLLTLTFILLAGSIITLTNVFHAYVFFNVPILIIWIVSLILSHRTDSYILSIILIVYTLISTASSFRIYQTLKQSIEKTILIQNQQKQLLLNQENLFRSEKMASMGEMLANIAHQWRQPLSSISMTASAIKLENSLQLPLTTEELDKKMDTVLTKVEYLSHTIETFRNFMKEDKEKSDVLLQERIKMVFNVLDTVLKDSHIKIHYTDHSKKDLILNMVVGELDQVLINIINNSKDAILQKHILNPWIKLSLDNNDTHTIITIEDNGGGIPQEIISRIFEPYFTTKHQSQGTGLGLHMSYKIITESLKGDLYVQNTQNGAKFFIEIPLIS